MIFKRYSCPACGKKIKKEWNYCPECGFRLSKGAVSKLPEHLPIHALPPGKKSNIISINISSGLGGMPKISVYGPEKLKKSPMVSKPPKKSPKYFKKPKKVEEPKIEEKNLGNKKIIEIKLPNVKSGDIEINELEESIEIRAFAGDKLYFKVIPTSPNYSLNKKFEKETLKLEILD
ncbi:MAG: zinc ribbon domain-containing protein [Candidatus Aenigmarchaeota archaeon]|nr:zinc ribbon domain-containing protein [Candidatus Aenigmarchaeota archaeon]